MICHYGGCCSTKEPYMGHNIIGTPALLKNCLSWIQISSINTQRKSGKNGSLKPFPIDLKFGREILRSFCLKYWPVFLTNNNKIVFILYIFYFMFCQNGSVYEASFSLLFFTFFYLMWNWNNKNQLKFLFIGVGLKFFFLFFIQQKVFD